MNMVVDTIKAGILLAYNPATDPASWAAFEGQNIPYYAADESWGPKLDGTLARHWDSWIPGHPNFGDSKTMVSKS